MASIKFVEAIPLAYSTMSSTMMPFLYQTRTIAGLYRSICNKRYRNRILPSIHRTNFHTSFPRASYEIQDRTQDSQDSQDSHDSQDAQDSQGAQGAQDSQDVQDNAGRNLQKWTPISQSSHSRRSKLRPKAPLEYRLDLEKSELESEGNIAGSIGFEEDDQTLVDYGKEIDELASPNYFKPESTITDSERHIFNRIFQDIFTRTQRTSLSDIDEKDMENLPQPNRESARNKLGNIMEVSLSRQPRTKEERKAEVNRYPPALRAAAARAIGFHPDEDSDTEIEDPVLGIDELKGLREPERERVEGLLRNANTDFELWEVLEKEVFTLIGKMGLSETKESRDQQRRGVHDSSIPPIKENPTTTTDVEPEVSPLALYGPLYPSHLLLGLRLLDRGYSKPSQLSLAILPRIKSFGLLSHVLGGSTPLYNELLRISWFRYDDFGSCIDLLREMEDAGLEFDSETLEVVTDILKVRAFVWKGTGGLKKMALWSLPEFKKSRHLEVWREKIAKVVESRRIEAGE
ncbi:hypothetical protein DSL72_003310 [Monilinia vaccinii-corymbosi]|uniref:Mtf2-like C-terminal domain-containing protein n=1 Tax=Monilinia vaccinii-corymbosi TaxID=61207 RepID=A0A8A3NSX6_9HELO|nr:hypothetical protein DSL72_003310 [Monilinia vaccinii-corymbosi]